MRAKEWATLREEIGGRAVRHMLEEMDPSAAAAIIRQRAYRARTDAFIAELALDLSQLRVHDREVGE